MLTPGAVCAAFNSLLPQNARMLVRGLIPPGLVKSKKKTLFAFSDGKRRTHFRFEAEKIFRKG